MENPSVPLAYEYDQIDKKPEVTNEMVRFNGVGDDGHETFLLARDSSGGFNFCKTACKPYDKYVVACLVLAKEHFENDIKVSSDGDMEDWKEGIELANKVLGRESNFVLG